jgi:hypothetical protein
VRTSGMDDLFHDSFDYTALSERQRRRGRMTRSSAHIAKDLRRIERESRIALQPRNLHRMPHWSSRRKPRPRPHLLLCCV